MYFLIAKTDEKRWNPHNIYLTADEELAVWPDEDSAEAYRKTLMRAERWRVRPATTTDFKMAGLRNRLAFHKKGYVVMGQDNGTASASSLNKLTSSGMLVDVFEDYSNGRFAIASRATTEDEFLSELAQAVGASTPASWTTRLRELLPLVVDMCCKYRGYRAESVQERRELMAGDLEMPVDRGTR